MSAQRSPQRSLVRVSAHLDDLDGLVEDLAVVGRHLASQGHDEADHFPQCGLRVSWPLALEFDRTDAARTGRIDVVTLIGFSIAFVILATRSLINIRSGLTGDKHRGDAPGDGYIDLIAGQRTHFSSCDSTRAIFCNG